MALSVNFNNVTLSDVIYGKYDIYEIGGLRERECPADNFVDVSVQFTEKHAVIAYLRDSGTVPLSALHQMLALHGINGMFPDEYGHQFWFTLTRALSSFMFTEATNDADRMDCYGAIQSMIYRYRVTPFGCPIHKTTITSEPFACNNYFSSCFFCITTLLLHVTSKLHFQSAPHDTIINLDVVMDECSQLTAFAFHMYTLLQGFYVECRHDECIEQIQCDRTQYNKHIIENCSRKMLSTAGSGIDSTLAIIEQLRKVSCPLTDSLFQREDHRLGTFTLERLAAFNFGVATKVVSSLLALSVPGASLIMRGYRTGYDRMLRHKLVIRMPEDRVNVDTIKDVMMAFPSVMLRIGASGFMIREFSEDDDNGFGSVLEKQFMYRIYYDLCRAHVHDTTVIPEPQFETRKHNIMEIAHQITVNGAPISQMEEDAFIKVIRLYQMAIAENFSFATVRFGTMNDTRAFMRLVRTPDLRNLKIYTPLYSLASHTGLHYVTTNALIEAYNTTYLGQTLFFEMDFIIRFADDHGRTQTVILPRLEWELNGTREEDNVQSTTKEFENHNDLMEQLRDKRELRYNEWVRMRQRARFMIKSANCRDEC